MFLAEQLDRPNLASVRNADLAEVTEAYETDLALARERHRQRADQVRSDLATRESSDRGALDKRFRPLIDDLEQRLEREMNNVVGGIFKGPKPLSILPTYAGSAWRGGSGTWPTARCVRHASTDLRRLHAAV